MLKKIFISAICLMMLIISAGCGSSDEGIQENTIPAATGTSQPDPLSTTASTTAETTTTTTSVPKETTISQTSETTTKSTVEKKLTTTKKSTTTKNSDDSEETATSTTVTTEKPAVDSLLDSMSDEELIFTAENMFKAACDAEWKFHVGCPYSLDYQNYVENSLGWQYFLITDPSINSIGDIEADYHKVFSDRYDNDLAEVFIEQGGRAYSLDGGRGMDIYYEKSVVTKVTQRTPDEIFFTVENFYIDDGYTGSGPYSEEKDFSIVISEDGSMRAGLFTLPY